jgi:hypothetical protein
MNAQPHCGYDALRAARDEVQLARPAVPRTRTKPHS